MLLSDEVFSRGPCRRRAEHAINTVWAKLTTLFYYPVEIQGLENLPAFDQPAVYVSNHQSFLVGASWQRPRLQGAWASGCRSSVIVLCLWQRTH